MAGRVPAVLRAHLGNDGTFGLIELLEIERREWSQQVSSAAADRFERRLAEELSQFRHEIAHEMATTRVEQLKWSFVFWIGQVAPWQDCSRTCCDSRVERPCESFLSPEP